MIRGLFAGAAKGYMCQRMAEIANKVVFVCLLMCFCKKFKGGAMTVSIFLGISFGQNHLTVVSLM